MKNYGLIFSVVLVFIVGYHGMIELINSGLLPSGVGKVGDVIVYTALMESIIALCIILVLKKIACCSGDCNEGLPVIYLIPLLVIYALPTYVGYWGFIEWIKPIQSERTTLSVIIAVVLTIIFIIVSHSCVVNFLQDDLCCKYGGGCCCRGCNDDDGDESDWYEDGL